MFFFNLSLGEFLALWGAVSGAVVALYLLDRSRQSIRVATLRFWHPSEKPPEAKHRKRIRQPLSMLLQILGLGLLVAALSQLRLGSPERSSRDHILLLDTSAWMSAREGQRSLMDEAKISAVRWLRSLPASDRVMVVRADALPTPATVFETNKAVSELAVLQSAPGSSSIDLQAAIEFARQMQRQHGEGTGEIVLVGAARSHSDALPPETSLPAGVRWLSVKEPTRNIGIRSLHLRRAPQDAQLWEIFVAVRNYGRVPETAPLMVTFGNAPVGSSRLTIAPGAEETARYEFRTKAAGWMEARLQVRDALVSDNNAMLEIPEHRPVRVTIYSREPDLLRPLMAANPRIAATFAAPETYKADADADIVVIDRFRPPAKPVRNSVWIEPPPEGAPLAVVKADQPAKLTRWRNDHPIAAGLRNLDLKIDNATLFAISPNVSVVAEADGGALVAATAQSPRAVYLGFHPGGATLKYQVAAPLLMANILEWMAPDVFRRSEINGESVGAVKVPIEAGSDPALYSVVDENQQPLPFSISGNTLQFYSGSRGTVRVRSANQETVYSLSLPDVGDVVWQAPAKVRKGFSRVSGGSAPVHELWHWLAILGALILFAEWFLFGRIKLPPPAGAAPAPIQMLRRAIAPFRKAS